MGRIFPLFLTGSKLELLLELKTKEDVILVMPLLQFQPLKPIMFLNLEIILLFLSKKLWIVHGRIRLVKVVSLT